MASRRGLIGQAHTPVDPIPEPNRHISRVSAQCRVYFPPNATRKQIINTLTEAYTDVLRQIQEELPTSRENVWLRPPEGWKP